MKKYYNWCTRGFMNVNNEFSRGFKQGRSTALGLLSLMRRSRLKGSTSKLYSLIMHISPLGKARRNDKGGCEAKSSKT